MENTHNELLKKKLIDLSMKLIQKPEQKIEIRKEMFDCISKLVPFNNVNCI